MKLVDGSMSDESKARLASHVQYTVPGPKLGPVNRATLIRDPRHLGFTLARYKFVSKMLAGMDEIVEIGCHEATGSLVVAREVGRLTAVDVQADVIDFCNQEYGPLKLNVRFEACDVLDGLPRSSRPDGLYKAAYLLDVLEHVDPSQEDIFIDAICRVLDRSSGVLIVGIPSLESQAYASPVSAGQHINCKTSAQLKAFLSDRFANVFMFGMNDEVLHTGFAAMSHYLFALAVGPK